MLAYFFFPRNAKTGVSTTGSHNTGANKVYPTPLAPKVLVMNIAVADQGTIGEIPVPALSRIPVSFFLGTL